MITPRILTRIEQFTGIESAKTSEQGASLHKQVRMALFTPDKYVQMLNISEFYNNRFIVDNIVHKIESLPVVQEMKKSLHFGNVYRSWNEPRYDLECGAMIDFINQSTIIEIRLTSCTTPAEFAIQCDSYKYHRTAAFVIDGLKRGNYIIIGVNKKKYNTFTVNINNDSYFNGYEWLSEGRAEYEELIDKFLLMDEVQRDSIILN